MKLEEFKISLTSILPHVSDLEDPRMGRFISVLESKDGVEQGYIKNQGNVRDATICLQYNPQIIALSQLEQIVKTEGEKITEKFEHENAAHEHSEDKKHSHDTVFFLGERAELIYSIVSAFALIFGYGVEKYYDFPTWVVLSFYIGAYFFGGFFTFIEAFENLKRKHFEIDTLMLVAAIGAAILGEWAEGSLLLVLFSLGHALEHYAMGRAKRAIEALAELAPKTAHVYRDSQIQEIEVSKIVLKDRVLIRSNERIPVDGYIVKGSSAVNQAPVTGESIPVDKVAIKDSDYDKINFDKIENENRVFAGTINGSGALEVIVMKLSSESTLARIAKLVSAAQAEASPTEQLTKKIERYFVPTILIIALLLPFAFLILNESASDSFYRAMALLVAASPCALAISTPSAVLSGIARAGRSGVLVKSGAALENLGLLTAVAFDKTGTLTEGKPVVTDFITLNNTSENELLKITTAVERASDHPLAKAIITYAESRLKDPVPVATNVNSLTGKGIEASVEGRKILIAKPAVFMDRFASVLSDPVEKLRSSGRTIIVVATNDQVLGIFGVMDKPRKSAKEALNNLLKAGIKKSIMLSGDHQKVAEAVAKEIGLTGAQGDLMPDDKVMAIKNLRKEFRMVAMVGDGVNDAPAMAAATVGIAMGAAGSDVALETADIALMTDDLNQLVFSVKMSRQASHIIKQNLWVSLGVVAILIPATLFGLGIGPAVALHEGSTLIVVFNALRLLLYRE